MDVIGSRHPTEVKAGTSTLLIVGSDDGVVVDPNREAIGELACDKRLLLVPGATLLFEEPGKLDEVAHAAGDWFVQHLRPPWTSRALPNRSAWSPAWRAEHPRGALPVRPG